MKLIFLYGVPGSGKLTIAKELIKQLGDDYKLFHNQMTVDLVSQFFPFASEKWSYLNGQFRKLLIEACVKEGINLVVTQVYAHDYPGNIEHVRQIIEMVENAGGKAHFVHLQCDIEIIFQRIQNEDRKAHRKVRDPAKLQNTMNTWDILTPIDFVENLTINTGELSPEESANTIIHHYNLKNI